MIFKNGFNIFQVDDLKENLVLSTVSRNLTDKDIDNYKNTLLKMLEWVKNKENNSVGLALPQIGINLTAFIAYNPYGKIDGIFINPSYTVSKNEKIDISEEGCLSIDGKDSYNVERYKKIQVKYININGKKIKETLKGYDAYIFQHEYDHLQGITIDKKGIKL